MRLLPLALVLLVLPGCFLNRSRVNDPIDPEVVLTLQPGATAGDVVAALGAPTEVVQLGKRSAYRYHYAVEKQSGLFLLVLGVRGVERKEDRAWFFFDENQVLTHVGSTFESNLVAYRVPLFQK